MMTFKTNNAIFVEQIKLVLSRPIFWISVILLLLHQLVQKKDLIKIAFFDAYLDDFLAMPFMLSLFLVEQYFWKRRINQLTFFEIATFTVIFAIFFELILPHFNANYTKDYWDFLAYSLGSLAFYVSNRT